MIMGKSGKLCLQSTKHFWSFTAKQRCSILQKSWSRWELVSKQLKKIYVFSVQHPNPSLWQLCEWTCTHFRSFELYLNSYSENYGFKKRLKTMSLHMNLGLRAPRDLEYAEWAVWSHFFFKSCNCRSWTKLHPTLHQLAGEKIMTEFYFGVNLSFNNRTECVMLSWPQESLLTQSIFSISPELIVIFLGTIRTMRMRRRSPTCEFLSVL